MRHGGCVRRHQVCFALGEWGARWLDVASQRLDPSLPLWSMCNELVVERVPDRRLVIRFDFLGQPKKVSRFWMLLEHRSGEVCVSCPGEENLVITADAERFIHWQMGRLTWAAAAAQDGIRIDGPRPLARAFPSWNAPGRSATSTRRA